jgi:hypothetical protein
MRFGLPLVLPIRDGTGPLGLIFFIVGFGFPNPAVKGLKEIIEIVQYLFEFFGAGLGALFPKAFIDFVVNHHESRYIIIFPNKLECLVFVCELGACHS